MKNQDLPSRRLYSLYRTLIDQVHTDASRQLYMEMDSDPNPVGFRYNQERTLFYCIAAGDLQRAENMLRPAFETLTGSRSGIVDAIWTDFQVGTLSEQPFQQMLYLFISNITLCTRAAMDGGLPEREAYAMSDAYIRQGTAASDLQALGALTAYAMYDFTKAVHDHRFRNCSRTTRICCDYIHRHMHDPIRMADLAEITGRSANYVSDLFFQELGERPTRYIRRVKLEYARNVLQISDLSVAAVSDLLAFPSTSSFISAFKKEYDVSPFVWRNKNKV